MQPVPKFKSIQEEAEWWDKTDTSEWMDEGEWIPAGTMRPVDNRCRKCGGKAQMERGDWQVADEGVFHLRW